MITNYLSPASFLVSVDRMPHVEFFSQKVNIPDVSGNPQTRNSPLGVLYDTPSILNYADLDITFIVDEDMKNYLEILNWLEGMGSPEDQSQYKTLTTSDSGTTSDITVIVNNNHKNPNVQFKFKDCFPISIGAISLDLTASDIQYIECTASFRYTNFTVATHS